MSEEQTLNEENVNENIPPPQNIEPPESEISKSDIPKSEKKMEVHHHPHVEKKNFKEYLLEFVMIFLAVTMGFFAENIREKSADRYKEKEYMHSMASDLQSDIAGMNRAINYLTYVINGHDSLEAMLSEVSNKNDFEFYRKLYYANTVFTWNDRSVVFTEATISELKSSGSL